MTPLIVHKFIKYRRQFGLFVIAEIFFQKLLRKNIYKLHIRGLKTPLSLRVGTDDMTVLKQIFADNELDISLKETPETIIDAGANVGYSARFFNRCYPDADIISIEPEPSNIKIFRDNCHEIKKIHLIEGGLWPRSSFLEITNPDGRKDGFQVAEHSEESGASIRGYTITEILDKYNIDKVDLLKIDIEGSEKELFESDISCWISKVKVIAVECHDRFKTGCQKSVYNALKERSSDIKDVGEYKVFYLKNGFRN